MARNIRYARHAEKRLQERFISRQDVEDGILNQEWQDAYEDRKKVVTPINGKEVEVVFKPEDNKILELSTGGEVMDLSFDREADAVYIRLSGGEVEENRKLDEKTIIDLDEDGEIVGIELLGVSERFSGLSQLSIDFADEGQATV